MADHLAGVGNPGDIGLGRFEEPRDLMVRGAEGRTESKTEPLFVASKTNPASKRSCFG